MDRELAVATAAARAAADAIRAVYNRDDFEVRFKDGDRGPLTEADLAADAVIRDHLVEAFPDDGLLSEETTDDLSRLGKRRVWIVDPLDGTREFTLRMPEFCVSIGLVVDGAPVLGVLLNPATGELITGVAGRGATIDGQPARVSTHARIEGARFLVSRSEHKKGWFDEYADVAALQPLGSVAWKLGLVAIGRAEATFTPKPRNEWDLCGGAAIVAAAGGRTSDGSGTPYVFNCADPLKIGVCATNGAMHDLVLGMMRR